jgi:hypothetical protein
MLDENSIRIKLLSRVLSGADPETAKHIMLLGQEMTVFRLLVAVAKIDPHLSRGLLVIKYGVTEEQAKQARREANKKLMESE